jgi:uncharacterized membrane protein YcaP (DUF421 family)
MEIVLRSAAVYVLVLAFLRLSGKRTMAQLTTFDFVLLLIVSESTQQALLGDDFSIVGGALAVLTLIVLNRVSDTISWRWDRFDRLVNDGALVIVEHGEPHYERMAMARIDVDDVLEEARAAQGIERMDQIKYAVLERTGSVSIVPESG